MMKSKVDKKILFFVISLAVVIHLIGFGALQGMKINFHSLKKPLMESHYVQSEQKEEQAEKVKDEVAERNAQLAKAFLEFTKENTEDKKHVEEFSEQTDTILELVFADEQNEGLLLETDGLACSEEGAEIDTLSLQDAFDAEGVQGQELLQQLIYVDEDRLSTDLHRASKATLGDIVEENIETLADGPSMKVGALEAESAEGNSLDDASGLIDRGNVNPSLREMSGIMTGVDNGNGCGNELIAFAGTDARVGINSGNAYVVGHVARSDDFDVDIAYAPKSDERGYLFRITLNSKEGVAFKTIKKNVTFLVDKSLSITNSRFEATKKALAKLLDDLNAEDTFNIIFFDHTVTTFRDSQVSCTEDNLDQAKAFMARQGYGGLYTSTDLYSSLDKIVPRVVEENEVNIAILVSDGDTYMNRESQRKAIREWTLKNKGKVSLYSLASGKANNFPLLNTLSVFNKGYLYTSENNDDLYPAMKKILKEIKAPIGKDIALAAVPKGQGRVELSPPSKRSPNLFESQPYVVYGVADSLEDFYLFFQGKYYDKRINIKRLISFDQAEEVASESLEKMWSIQKVYTLYEHYLLDGLEKHIQKAKEILEPYGLPSAF